MITWSENSILQRRGGEKESHASCLDYGTFSSIIGYSKNKSMSVSIWVSITTLKKNFKTKSRYIF